MANITKAQGYDIVSEIQISFPQAALGTEINVQTIDGDVKIKIPSGTQSGTIMRLGGRGVPHVRGNAKGDHYVKIQVTTPKNLNNRQKDLLKEFDAQTK